MDMDPKSHKFLRLVVPGWTPHGAGLADPLPQKHGKPGLVERSQRVTVRSLDRPIGVDSNVPSISQVAMALGRKIIAERITFGIWCRANNGLWVGGHYSEPDLRWEFNPIPCITFYMVFPGGKLPQKKKPEIRNLL
jgi:hypothetical protein